MSVASRRGQFSVPSSSLWQKLSADLPHPCHHTGDLRETKHLSPYGANELKKPMLWCCKNHHFSSFFNTFFFFFWHMGLSLSCWQTEWTNQPTTIAQHHNLAQHRGLITHIFRSGQPQTLAPIRAVKCFFCWCCSSLMWVQMCWAHQHGQVGWDWHGRCPGVLGQGWVSMVNEMPFPVLLWLWGPTTTTQVNEHADFEPPINTS